MSQAPVKVSPLIKFARWSMLTSGIIYGAIHKRRLSAKEATFRAEEAKKNKLRDAQLAEEKRRAHENEIKALAMLSRPEKH